MKKLYFVRHGITEMNVSSHVAGITETPLTKEGRQQAKLAGQKAKDLKIDYIVCSPMSRAHETAKIIAKEIGYPADKIHLNDLLIERDFGVLEGQPWTPDLDLDGIADIETVDSILERARLALEFIKSLDARNILVVAHGSIGRALRHHIYPDLPFANKTSTRKTMLQNGEIVQWV